MTNPIKGLFDRHSVEIRHGDPGSTPAEERAMTLDQFRAALTEFAPKRPSDEEIAIHKASIPTMKEIVMEGERRGADLSYAIGFQVGGKYVLDRIFGQDKSEGE